MAECRVSYMEKNEMENQEYQLNEVRKEEIIERLREMGCRITRQRRILIDVILESECTCCKEIYYIAVRKMPEIGMATIYRMLNSLEEIGAIKRKNIYRVCTAEECVVEDCVVELENQKKVELSKDSLWQILEIGMKAYGYSDMAKVTRVVKKNEV